MDTRVKDPNPCRVIGVLDDGTASLGPTALAHLRTADLVIGGARTLALLRHEFKPGAQARDLGGQISAVADWVREAREAQRRCVVLATGDPLCHGIAPFAPITPLAARARTSVISGRFMRGGLPCGRRPM